jgi:hypothetical protein
MWVEFSCAATAMAHEEATWKYTGRQGCRGTGVSVNYGLTENGADLGVSILGVRTKMPCDEDAKREVPTIAIKARRCLNHQRLWRKRERRNKPELSRQKPPQEDETGV